MKATTLIQFAIRSRSRAASGRLVGLERQWRQRMAGTRRTRL